MTVCNENALKNVTALIPERIKQRLKKGLFCDCSIPELDVRAKQLQVLNPQLCYCSECDNFFIK